MIGLDFDARRTLRAMHWLALAGVLLISAVLRCGSAAGTEVREPLRGDALDYVGYAWNLERHGVYSRLPTWKASADEPPPPDALRPPLYPLLLTTSLAGVPDDAFVRRVAWLQAGLGLLVVALCFEVSRRSLGPELALGVATLAALSPHLIAHESVLLTETLFTLVVLLAALAYASWVKVPPRAMSLGLAFLTGLLAALATLVRPTLDYLPHFAVAAVLLWPEARSGWKAAVVALAAFFAVVLAWKARNLAAIGEWSDPALSLRTLLHGSYIDFMYEGRSESYGYAYAFDPQIATAESSAGTTFDFLRERFLAAPGSMAWWYLVGKPLALFDWHLQAGGWRDFFTYPVESSPWLSHPIFKGVAAAMRGLHWPLVGLSALGTALALAGRALPGMTSAQVRLIRGIALLMLYVVAVHIVGAPYPRYSVPFRPETYLLALYGAVFIARRLVRQ